MTQDKDTLIVVPTYNEADNAPKMFERLNALGLDADILFVDDASPDGTGQLMEQLAQDHPHLRVMIRQNERGIGGAHLAGIFYAYDQGYKTLVTLDCDFSHTPEDVPRLLRLLDGHDLVVGSRYMRRKSLEEWNLLRRSLTKLGHALTEVLLDMGEDATGAFRVYDLTRVPRGIFERVNSRGYSFFFESLFLMTRNGLTIAEAPIELPARTYGSSKMSLMEASRSAKRVFKLWFETTVRPEQFSIAGAFQGVDEKLMDPQGWDEYWGSSDAPTRQTYQVVAALYRNLVIQRTLNRALSKNFERGSRLLHAGCGSGQLDSAISRKMRVSAIDVSPAALNLYVKNNPHADEIRHASIFDLPYPDGSFDGVYNLGVIEHFEIDEITRMLKEFSRVLKPGGKVVLFWPHKNASSVMVLGALHSVLNNFSESEVRLHPEEVSLLSSKTEAKETLQRAGLELMDYSFGPQDLFVQAIVVGQK